MIFTHVNFVDAPLLMKLTYLTDAHDERGNANWEVALIKQHSLAPEQRGPTITVGEILVEIMATKTGNGFREQQLLQGPFPSGAPAIFIDQVARLGGKCGIVSTVGNDDFGTLNIERLKNDGVDTSAVAISLDKPTGSAFVRYRDDGSRDFIFNISHSAAGETRLDPTTKRYLQSAGHLHIMGSAFAIPVLAEGLIAVARDIKQGGGSISLDPNLRKELLADRSVAKHISEIVELTDLLLPSGDEILTLCGKSDEAAAVDHLLSIGIKEIVLKRGKFGATQFEAGRKAIDCPPFEVNEVDPTGAGDCFGATYLTCRRFGMTVEQSLTYANAAGAYAVTRLGPMEGVTSFAELDRFISNQERSQL